jgi:hypothetical protein
MMGTYVIGTTTLSYDYSLVTNSSNPISNAWKQNIGGGVVVEGAETFVDNNPFGLCASPTPTPTPTMTPTPSTQPASSSSSSG